ncbi:MULTISPECIES: LysR substrate-binding domain-containing protein [unclassified Cupriavidus]|uniref:LysR substrate-binding domain-containing protein n=1 Tax=unclassified Cupriavidus TaxID=2640874 RepID=UPI003F8F1B28
METKWLEDFLCLAETRSFSRAASDRHITQSAFSRRIMALEEWLGVSLVDRSVHPATLTTAGWLFRRLAADLLRDAYAARALLSSRQPLAESGQVIRFAVAHTLVFTFFPNWLKCLHERFGSLSACVHAVNVPEGVQQLVDDDCDILLGYHHQQLPILLDPNGFPFLMLGVERILPFSAPDKQGQPIFRLPGTSANRLPFMAYSSGAFLGNVVEMILLNAPEPYGLQRCFETHMSEALKAMVVAGHGVGWLPESCVSDELKEGKLVVAGPAAWATSLDIRLYRSVASPKPLVEELWSAISQVPDPQLMMQKTAESSDCGML